jgi:hypothetical protein
MGRRPNVPDAMYGGRWDGVMFGQNLRLGSRIVQLIDLSQFCPHSPDDSEPAIKIEKLSRIQIICSSVTRLM